MCLKSINAHSKGVSGAIILCNNVLMTNGLDKQLRFWNIENGMAIKSLNTPKLLGYKLKLCDNGRALGYVFSRKRLGICIFYNSV